MAESRGYVVRELPAWEKKVLDHADQQRDQIWLAKSFKHDYSWSEYAPLPADLNLKTWKAEKCALLSERQKKTLNRAIQEGWFAYGWDHPPGSGGADGKCSGPCCPAPVYGAPDDDNYEEEEDDYQQYRTSAKKKKGAGNPEPAPTSMFIRNDGEPLEWRFARVAFFAYFGDRATTALRVPLQSGARSSDAAGVLYSGFGCSIIYFVVSLLFGVLSGDCVAEIGVVVSFAVHQRETEYQHARMPFNPV